MKKLSWLFLLLLLTSCIANNTGPETISKSNIQKGDSKQAVKSNFFYTSSMEDPFWVDARYSTGRKHYYDRKNQIEIMYNARESVFLVFTNVTSPVDCKSFPCSYGNGNYDSTHYSLNAAKQYVNSISSAKQSIQLAEMINQAKNTCKTLGFNEGTEKFKDCSLKLYSQSLDLAAKQNQQVVVQSQGSSDTIRVIDVTRERENTLRKAGGLIDGSCTLATYYKC